LETGLGGRLDATNMADAEVSVITPISLEHTYLLGDTLAEIAREKCGIIRPLAPCVSAPQEPEVLTVIEAACAENSADLMLVGRDIEFEETGFDRDRQNFSVRIGATEYSGLETKLRGVHQIANAACAVGAIDALRARGVAIKEGAIKRGISRCEWPGRLEVVGEDPLVVLDGAQNPASAAALAEAVKRHFKFKKLLLVLGTSYDKDIEGIYRALSKIADSAILTRADNPRAADPEEMKKRIGDDKAEIVLDSRSAIDAARNKAGKEDMILAAGSLYLVGEIKNVIAKRY